MACGQACKLGNMGFIDSLRGGKGPLSHDNILESSITASIHPFLSFDDRLERFNSCPASSSNGMSLMSAGGSNGDEVSDDSSVWSYINAPSNSPLVGWDDGLGPARDEVPSAIIAHFARSQRQQTSLMLLHLRILVPVSRQQSVAMISRDLNDHEMYSACRV